MEKSLQRQEIRFIVEDPEMPRWAAGLTDSNVYTVRRPMLSDEGTYNGPSQWCPLVGHEEDHVCASDTM